jgi:hypothetical protein
VGSSGTRGATGSSAATRARPAAQSPAVTQNLNRDFEGRQRGAAQTQRFASAGAGGGGARRAGGAGGARGGGGRGGRGR